jgi:predicted neutral ceramidase superfamily lipid hydrolase
MMDAISASLIPRSSNAFRVSLIVFLIELRRSLAVALIILLIFSTLAAILLGICCKRVALMDGLVASIADVTFFAGLINDDNKFEVEFAAKLLPVDEIKYDRTIEDADKISIVVKPYMPLRNLFCTPSQYLKGNPYIRIEGYLRA